MSGSENKLIKNIKAWLSLVRFPNLFTVPGDAIFGYLVVNGKMDSPNFILVIAAVLFCYMFGLVTNDIADYATDLKERPSRPLPAGLVSLNSARFAAAALCLAALASSIFCGQRTFSTCLVLVILIIGYNYMFKHIFLIGPAILALCRMLGLMLGLFAANSIELTSTVLYPALIFLTIYVFGFSISAQVEVEEGRRKTVLSGAWLVMTSSILWIFAGLYFSTKVDDISVMDEITPSGWLAIIFSAILCLRTLKGLVMLHLKYKASIVPPFIGESVRNLILIQASACAFAGFMNEAFLVALLFIPAWIFSRIYHQS
ncbi:MAG TPA: hypothetical protein DCZ94_02305 [Lentisphaeria bacterium]|nr:MAG: hypothetical protein A2X48_16245 [Lentisphaerae bacterium GWF2_49_21]HBC85766.1 hypothetical protein [Lentisphaeria bacterium]